MSWVRRREIPLLIFAITFIIGCFGYYIEHPVMSEIYSTLFDWVLLMSNLALGTGLIAMTLYHGKKIAKREKGYEMSFVVFGALILMFVSCYASPASREYLYAKIYTPASIAILCFTGFSEISGLYRAFRVRSVEAFFLALAGFILLMHFAPVYGFFIPGVEKVASWLLDNPAMGASRGIVIGVAIGTIAIAIRVLLGYEKAYTG